MRIRVLGSAAGGGFPQWNCGCANCAGARNGTIRASARTQESVALTADGAGWFLVNASPEIRQQLESAPELWPRERRHWPIAAILLTNGDLDHCLGLLSLRESHPLVIYATEAVRRGFTENNVLYRTLQRFPGQVTWRALELGVEQPLAASPDEPGDLFVTAVPAAGKRPLHLEELVAASPEDNVGLLIRDARTKKVLAYHSTIAGPSPALADTLAPADCVFFDGTFWSSDELIAQGLGTRRAEDMAHWPIGGAAGSLSFLRTLSRPRRILIHINNTNPILREDSPERAQVVAAGVEVAHDGMDISL